MRLLYTPRSHFSRKVRLLLASLGIAVELVDAGNVGDAGPEAFGPNPLMRVPTLIDGDVQVFESDHIAAWLVRRHDPDDRLGVLTGDVELLNLRAVMNGVMAAEVELILAARSGIDTTRNARFDKLRATISNGLGWLEGRRAHFPAGLSYAGLHLLAMWDHLAFYGLVPLPHPGLAAIAAGLDARPELAASRPR